MIENNFKFYLIEMALEELNEEYNLPIDKRPKIILGEWRGRLRAKYLSPYKIVSGKEVLHNPDGYIYLQEKWFIKAGYVEVYWILRHEFSHHLQYINGVPFDEDEADLFADEWVAS